MKSRATQSANEAFRVSEHKERGYADSVSGAPPEQLPDGPRESHLFVLDESPQEDDFGRLYEESLKGLREGTIIEGKIKAVREFGIFIRIDQGIEGLVHISNISRGRIGHPAEAYRIGDRVEAKVLDLDRELERVSLGKREMAPQ